MVDISFMRSSIFAHRADAANLSSHFCGVYRTSNMIFGEWRDIMINQPIIEVRRQTAAPQQPKSDSYSRTYTEAALSC